MSKVARSAFVLVAFTFLLAATVVLAQRLAGDSDVSLIVPCALVSLGLGIGGLAWYLGISAGEEGGCSVSEREEGESEVANVEVDGQQSAHE